MAQLFVGFTAWTPGQAGLFFLLTGMAVGSFSSVILHRIPRGESIVAPRSRCPHCAHTLGVADLIPVFSFLWLRGHCRHCGSKISPWYPILELLPGGFAGAAGMMSGVAAGLTTIAVWIAAATGLALTRRHHSIRNESGFTLVEVLVSLGLLGLVMGGFLTSINMSRSIGLIAQRNTLAVGLARKGFAQANLLAAQALQMGQALDDTTWDYGDYQVHATFSPKGATSWWVTITTTCNSCNPGLSAASPAVSLTGVVSP